MMCSGQDPWCFQSLLGKECCKYGALNCCIFTKKELRKKVGPNMAKPPRFLDSQMALHSALIRKSSAGFKMCSVHLVHGESLSYEKHLHMIMIIRRIQSVQHNVQVKHGETQKKCPAKYGFQMVPMIWERRSAHQASAPNQQAANKIYLLHLKNINYKHNNIYIYVHIHIEIYVSTYKSKHTANHASLKE